MKTFLTSFGTNEGAVEEGTLPGLDRREESGPVLFIRLQVAVHLGSCRPCTSNAEQVPLIGDAGLAVVQDEREHAWTVQTRPSSSLVSSSSLIWTS